MKKLFLEAIRGANGTDKVVLIVSACVVAAAIVYATIMMVYCFRNEIRGYIRYKLVKLAYELEMIARTIERKLDMRDSYEDFYTISDWARYAEFQATKIPTWYQVVGQMLKGAYR